jgi:hypothetical protein
MAANRRRLLFSLEVKWRQINQSHVRKEKTSTEPSWLSPVSVTWSGWEYFYSSWTGCQSVAGSSPVSPGTHSHLGGVGWMDFPKLQSEESLPGFELMTHRSGVQHHATRPRHSANHMWSRGKFSCLDSVKGRLQSHNKTDSIIILCFRQHCLLNRMIYLEQNWRNIVQIINMNNFSSNIFLSRTCICRWRHLLKSGVGR